MWLDLMTPLATHKSQICYLMLSLNQEQVRRKLPPDLEEHVVLSRKHLYLSCIPAQSSSGLTLSSLTLVEHASTYTIQYNSQS